MVKVPAPKMSVVLTLAVVAEPVMAMVTVPKPAVVDPAAVLVTATLPTLEFEQEFKRQDIELETPVGAALLFAK